MLDEDLSVAYGSTERCRNGSLAGYRLGLLLVIDSRLSSLLEVVLVGGFWRLMSFGF